MLRDNFIYIYSPNEVQDVKLIDDAEDGSTSPPVVDGQTRPSPGSSRRMASGRGTETPEYSLGSRAAAAAGLSPGGGRCPMADGDCQSPADSPKLVFSSGGRQLSRHLTVYQAIQNQLLLEADDYLRPAGSSGSQRWSDAYTITYQRADRALAEDLRDPSAAVGNSGSRQLPVSLLDSMLQGELPCDLEKSNATYGILALLRVLEGLNRLAPRLRAQAAAEDFAEGKIAEFSICAGGARVPPEEFINNKLAPKLSRQTQEAVALLSGVLPPWCRQLTGACPFLFPFEVRRQYFYSTALGPARALRRLQQQRSADGHGLAGERDMVVVDRLQRLKVRVSRARILESAARVLGTYSGQKTVLDVEFLGEVGTGLGPTLEYYTLLSREFQSAELGMWRHSSSMPIHGDSTEEEEEKKPRSEPAVDLVGTPLGLFPRPWPPSADESSDPAGVISKVAEFFRLLGRFVAKAIQDGRLLDLPLSTAFYKLVLGQVNPPIQFNNLFLKRSKSSCSVGFYLQIPAT